LAIAGSYGYFCIWNYNTKEKLNIKYEAMTPSKDEVREPSSMEYTPDGKFLIVAYKTGII
jgi:hypothetical protein